MLAFGCGSVEYELQQIVAFFDVAEQDVVGVRGYPPCGNLKVTVTRYRLRRCYRRSITGGQATIAIGSLQLR